MSILKLTQLPIVVAIIALASTSLHATELGTSKNTKQGKSSITNLGAQSQTLNDNLSFVQAKGDRLSSHFQHQPIETAATVNAKLESPLLKTAVANKEPVMSKNDAALAFFKRQNNPNTSHRYGDFTIYNAKTYLHRDIDGDGYHSEFEIVFDADTDYNSADVYGVLYISKHGGPWEFYYETEVFRINRNDSDDEYSVKTALNYGFPSDQYDILIDLYEYGYSGIVATISARENRDLDAIPLEDRSYEVSYSNGFDIHDITTTLTNDRDGDGFFSEFTMSIDIDTSYAQSLVYAEVYFLNQYNEWELNYTSSDISLRSNSSSDSIDIDFDWRSGFPTRYYDFKVVVLDAYSHQRLFETGRNYNALNALPLESNDVDNLAANQPVPHVNSTTSYGSGGGSLGLSVFALLVFMGYRTRCR